jgi:hypothetical protein
VEVEVVARHVGEQRDVEEQAGDAFLLQGVRRNLHGHRPRPGVAHPGEDAEQIRPFRRRAAARGRLESGKAVAERADAPAGSPRGVEHRGDQLDRGRLAVGAGDADERERPLGVREQSRRERAEERSRRSGDQPGRLAGLTRTRRTVGEDRGRAARDGLGGEARAVVTLPLPGDEEVPRLDRARIVPNAEDLGIVPEVSGEREAARELGELHPPPTSSSSSTSAPRAGSGLPGGGLWRTTTPRPRSTGRRSSPAVSASASRAVRPAKSGNVPGDGVARSPSASADARTVPAAAGARSFLRRSLSARCSKGQLSGRSRVGRTFRVISERRAIAAKTGAAASPPWYVPRGASSTTTPTKSGRSYRRPADEAGDELVGQVAAAGHRLLRRPGLAGDR